MNSARFMKKECLELSAAASVGKLKRKDEKLAENERGITEMHRNNVTLEVLILIGCCTDNKTSAPPPPRKGMNAIRQNKGMVVWTITAYFSTSKILYAAEGRRWGRSG